MCEKKKNEAENMKKGDGEKKNDSAAAAVTAEKKTASVTVVLKVEMHCEGCASRIVKCVRSLQGVETVKSETSSGKLTVTGGVDPVKLREKIEEKTKKKVELISPQPKKEKEKESNKDKIDESKNKENKSEEKKKPEEEKKKKDDDKKPKETPVTTAVLKLDFHCQGCVGKIQKTVTKTKGVDGITMDKEKQLVTVKGTMDVKKLVDSLSEKLKRTVEIVPPAKKEKEIESGDKKKGGDGGGAGGEKDSSGGGNKGGGSGGGGGDGVNMMEYMAAQPTYGYGYYSGGPSGYPVQAHAPQIFSDENPNACVVM